MKNRIVKQVSIDIETDKADIDLESIIKNLLEEKGYCVLGTEQIDMSEAYNKHN